METLINNPQVCEFKGDPGGRAKKRKHWQVFQPEKNHHGSSESHKKQVAPNALQGLAIEVSLSFTTLHGYLCRAKKTKRKSKRFASPHSQKLFQKLFWRKLEIMALENNMELHEALIIRQLTSTTVYEWITEQLFDAKKIYFFPTIGACWTLTRRSLSKKHLSNSITSVLT